MASRSAQGDARVGPGEVEPDPVQLALAVAERGEQGRPIGVARSCDVVVGDRVDVDHDDLVDGEHAHPRRQRAALRAPWAAAIDGRPS